VKVASQKKGEKKVIKDKNGGNGDGFGLYEMTRMAFNHPVYFSLLLLMIKFHMHTLAKKILGIH
jgi:hypothetical protein